MVKRVFDIPQLDPQENKGREDVQREQKREGENEAQDDLRSALHEFDTFMNGIPYVFFGSVAFFAHTTRESKESFADKSQDIDIALPSQEALKRFLARCMQHPELIILETPEIIFPFHGQPTGVLRGDMVLNGKTFPFECFAETPVVADVTKRERIDGAWVLSREAVKESYRNILEAEMRAQQSAQVLEEWCREYENHPDFQQALITQYGEKNGTALYELWNNNAISPKERLDEMREIITYGRKEKMQARREKLQALS